MLLQKEKRELGLEGSHTASTKVLFFRARQPHGKTGPCQNWVLTLSLWFWASELKTHFEVPLSLSECPKGVG